VFVDVAAAIATATAATAAAAADGFKAGDAAAAKHEARCVLCCESES
jgi:hypothetical protein